MKEFLKSVNIWRICGLFYSTLLLVHVFNFVLVCCFCGFSLLGALTYVAIIVTF